MKQFEPYDQVLVRTLEWEPKLFSYSNSDGEYHLTSGEVVLDDKDIIPYEGNEHLVGTSNDPGEPDVPDEEIVLNEDELGFASNIISADATDWDFIPFVSTKEYDYYPYFIRYSDFDPHNMKETMKHILCVNGEKIVRYNSADAEIERKLPNKEEPAKPKIKTWKDIEEYYTDADIELGEMTKSLYTYYSKYSIQLLTKCIATLKIAKLIELGYGGLVTDEEWRNRDNAKYYIQNDEYYEFDIYKTYNKNLTDFIAFHTEEQAKEFMSYPENVELVRQYYTV